MMMSLLQNIYCVLLESAPNFFPCCEKHCTSSSN